ncbi:hypothetical protein HanXRQr2_Chr03g0129481 [Helianthus annuus]|uniref:Uncharacterized protein n=1 Tax=Helianthus annuus TaxID=4232 RepID=A0A9K3JJK8_HELAN|nr:hypothetical protein HanXRQr2_Chr03g0129481 [Helianthus annuus]KAJ0609402.1 hypothetical protein HanHA89_Chr03g0119611 [Helianthus annuus]KAJ0769464.1 hypothetical protein HanLR1_Chr03g0113021 [Helianthus annuus]
MVIKGEAARAMVEAIIAEGKPVWLDQIRDRFLHPTSESFASYANTILGEDDGSDFDDTTDPTREEVIVLSSDGSDRSREGLILRSPSAGPAQGAVNEPMNEPVGDDADLPVETAEQLETRKKKKLDKSEKKGKMVEESVTEAPRKRPSTLPFLDYVMVSDTLSGLDAGDKRTERDPDDNETLTEILKKKQVLDDRKRELDEQAAAALAAKSVVISWRKYMLLLVLKEKRDDVDVEQVGEGGAAGAGGDAGGACGDGRGKGVETEAESSEATPRHTIYTKRPPGSGGGGASGVARSPEYENFQVGSWDTHNPACDDLLHAPRWKLTQDSQMSDHDNCREFFSLSLPPAERMFQKRRNRLDLLDDHIHAGREKFNAKKKGLSWRVVDAEQKSAQEKQFNTNKQKEWEITCERTNKELQAQREAIVRLSGEKTKISDEAEHERAAHQKREQEYVERIAKLEKFAEEKIAENKASEILVEEVTANCKWLLARAIAERIAGSEELAKYMYDLGEAAHAHGRKESYAEGRVAAEAKEPLKNFELYN